MRLRIAGNGAAGLNTDIDSYPFSPYELAKWYVRTYLKRYAAHIFVAFVFMSVQGGTLGLLSYMIKPMFDDVFSLKKVELLHWVGLLVLCLFVIRGLAGFVHRVITAWVGERVLLSLRDDLMRHVLTLDSVYFDDNPPGKLLDRILGDSIGLNHAWFGIVSTGIRDGISVIVLFWVAFSIDPLWTVVAIAGAPLLIFPIIKVHGFTRKFALTLRETSGEIALRLDEIFHGINAIKLNLHESPQMDRFLDKSRIYRRAAVRTVAGQASLPALVDAIAGLGFLGILMLAGRDVIDGTRTVGDFMSFFTAVVLLFDPIRRLGSVTGAWQVARVSLVRLHEVLNNRPAIVNPIHPEPPPADLAGSDIVFDDVSFSYSGLAVHTGLSFRAEAGKTTALVGVSGAGKTTVFNLLTRIVDPDSGTISFGGRDISSMDIATLRGCFSVVSQDSWLFDESIRDNILLGKPDATEAELERAADASLVLEFTDSLPEGLNTPAGVRGGNLSGGQRQRVAIARALLRNAPILLLDEPTSALDSQSEEIVQQALSSLMNGKTILTISHRFANVRDADKILVLDGGNLAEEGTHEALVVRGGLYARLCETQFLETR